MVVSALLLLAGLASGTEVSTFSGLTSALSVTAGSSADVAVTADVIFTSYILLNADTMILVDGRNAKFDAQSTRRFFVMQNGGTLKLQNITFANGYNGAISGTGTCYVELTNCTATNNVNMNAGSSNGGLMSFPDTTASTEIWIRGGLYEMNRANSDGGLIKAVNAKVHFINVIAKYNSASEGGVISVSGPQGSEIYVYGGTFESNYAEEGGVIAGGNAVIFIDEGTVFEKNEAQTTGGVFYLTDGGTLNITDALFKKNRATDGGILYTASSSVEVLIHGGTYKDQYATTGGCFNLASGDLTIFDGTFSNNRAVTGGVIEAGSAVGVFKIKGGTFKKNTAIYGGFVDTGISWTLAPGLTLAENEASAQGGFATLTGAEFTMVCRDGATSTSEATVIKGSTAPEGAALFVTAGSSVTVTGCIFKENDAASSGTIYVSTFSKCYLRDITSLSNVASDFGAFAYVGSGALLDANNLRSSDDYAGVEGIIYCSSLANVTLVDSVLSNSSTFSAGAVFTRNAIYVAMRNVEIRSPKAWVGPASGLVAVQSRVDTTISLHSTVFETGVANVGGAAYLLGIPSATFDQCTFLNNTGALGALHITDGAQVHVLNSTFFGNEATSSDQNGGALVVEAKSIVTLRNVIFQSNRAAGNGGAIALESLSTVDASGLLVRNNMATGSGGGLSVTGAATYHSNGGNAIVGNVAYAQGGGAYLSDGAIVSFNATTDSFTFNEAPYGGGGAAYADNSTNHPDLPLTLIGNTAMYGPEIASGIVKLQILHTDSVEEGPSDEELLSPIRVAVMDRYDQVVNTSNGARVNLAAADDDVKLSGSGITLTLAYGKAASTELSIGYYPNASVSIIASATIDETFISDTVAVKLRACAFNELESDFECLTCGADYYYDNGACHACSTNKLLCLDGSTLESIRTRKGWFRPTLTSTRVYKCFFRDACLGENTSANYYVPTEGSMLVVTDALVGEDICDDAYRGYLCSSCQDGYYAITGSGNNYECRSCQKTGGKLRARIAYAVMGALVALAGAWVLLSAQGQELFLFVSEARAGAASDVVALASRKQSCTPKDGGVDVDVDEEEDLIKYLTGSLVKYKTLVSFCQIITSFPTAFGAKLAWPVSYENFLRVIGSVVSLNVPNLVATQCLDSSSSKTYFVRSLLGVTLAPCGVAVLLWLGTHILAATTSQTERKRRKNRAFQVFLMIMHVSLPLCSSTPVTALVCSEFDEGDAGTGWYLRDELAISCESSLWRHFIRPYAWLCVFLYPIGVPVVYGILLWRSRHILNPIHEVPPPAQFVEIETQTYQHLLMRKRDELVEAATVDNVFENTKAFRFLWSDYEPRTYWWDAYDASRRVFYVAVLAAVESGSSTQIFVGFVVSMLAAFLYGKFRPFVHVDDDFIAESAVHAVALTLQVALLRRADVVLTGKRGEAVALLILFFAAFLPFAAFCWAARSLVARAIESLVTRCSPVAPIDLAPPSGTARIAPEPHDGDPYHPSADQKVAAIELHAPPHGLPPIQVQGSLLVSEPSSPAGSETPFLEGGTSP